MRPAIAPAHILVGTGDARAGARDLLLEEAEGPALFQEQSDGCGGGRGCGTVVQDPYQWGYQGMKLMAAYLKGDKSGIPADGLIIVPTQVIDKGNVDAFEKQLKERVGG